MIVARLASGSAWGQRRGVVSKTIDLRDVGEHRIKGRGLVLTIDERKHDDHIFSERPILQWVRSDEIHL